MTIAPTKASSFVSGRLRVTHPQALGQVGVKWALLRMASSARTRPMDRGSRSVPPPGGRCRSLPVGLGDLLIRGSGGRRVRRAGICCLVGGGQVAQVGVTFFGGERTDEFVDPSEALVAEKAEFASSRVRRWFGREWRATETGDTAQSQTAT